jgi:hypothetical protein
MNYCLFFHEGRIRLRGVIFGGWEFYMRLNLSFWILCANFFTVSCKQRDDNISETNAAQTNNAGAVSGLGRASAAADPIPFNAFQIWRDGKGSPILDYPASYDSKNGICTPDDVFCIKGNAYKRRLGWGLGGLFVSTTTQEAKVDGSILTYTAKDGRQLSLKFFPAAGEFKYHAAAAQFCANQIPKKRLPTMQELFDYCTAGSRRAFDGLYPHHRCGQNPLWSTGLAENEPKDAWFFTGGGLYLNVRTFVQNGFFCVGR